MSFRRMEEARVDQWHRIDELERQARPRVAERILRLLESLASISDGFLVDRLTHCLQTAARAERSGADAEFVVAALCHDVGMAISGENHAAIAAEILRPYVRDEIVDVVRTHDVFQGRYYFPLFGQDGDAYLQFRDEPWFPLATRFSDEWDQGSFDPDYDTPSLAHFEPLVRRIFAEPRPECEAGPVH
jgi:predicted HD phosphohydrolase